LLRKLDIPISDIKAVLETNSFESVYDVISKRLSVFQAQRLERTLEENHLLQVLSFLRMQSGQVITEERLSQLSAFAASISTNDEMEEICMQNLSQNGRSLKFVTLPPMRTVYNIAVGVTPEDFAMNPVLEWLNVEHLSGTARFFGGDMPPLPKGDGEPYGYGFCASVPENAAVSEHLKEMRLPGGVYAMLESTDDIGASWKELMKLLSGDEKYTSDRSRLCLEEHIRNDGNGFHIMLLEPVKARK
jgi:hypothetical protein